MTIKQLRITNVIIYMIYIFISTLKTEQFDVDFYGFIVLLCMLFGIIEVYLHELNN